MVAPQPGAASGNDEKRHHPWGLRVVLAPSGGGAMGKGPPPCQSSQGDARHPPSSIRIPLMAAALPDGSAAAGLGPRGSPARRGTSCRQLDRVSVSFWQVRTPLRGSSLQHSPGVGLFRGLLLPAPKKHHETNSQGTTGSPQQGTMAGTALPVAHKSITPASPLLLAGSDMSERSPETGSGMNLAVFHMAAA